MLYKKKKKNIIFPEGMGYTGVGGGEEREKIDKWILCVRLMLATHCHSRIQRRAFEGSGCTCNCITMHISRLLHKVLSD
jgi:hypothetical protein